MKEQKVKIKTFKDLLVWQKSHLLVLEIYKHTNTFPRQERFGLISQLRRSASSVATNIVEGYKKQSIKEFAYFLNTADCSLEETKYHILLSKDLGYLGFKEYEMLVSICEEVGRMLSGFQKSLRP